MSRSQMKSSDYEREKARVMNGIDINSEKTEMEENKRSVGSCVSDFTVVKELGRGSYGVVYRVLSNISKKEYVMKKINIKHMDQKHQKEAIKEANILRRVKHENIIRYYTSFVEHECLYIIMEYADGGDLQQLLRARREKKKQFTEQEIWDFGHDLIKAVDYLHKNNIIHRDIKTLNIFLTKEGKVKLGDLGVSKIISSQAALNGTRVGTPLYLAPELVKQQPYDIKVDIWAIGIVLYHISALEPPFQGENLIALGFNIVNKFPKPLPSIYSPKLVSFINKLLEKNPSNRPKTSELLDQFVVSKKSERPSTSSGVSSSQQSTTQQQKQHARPMTAVISDRMEVFDRGSFNLLNKIIEEDAELTVAQQMKKTEIIEKRQSIKRPNTGVPRTTKDKEEEYNRNSYNNMNLFKNKEIGQEGEDDPIFTDQQSSKQQQFSDNTPTIVTNSHTSSNKNLQNRGARSEHKNTDSTNENNNNNNNHNINVNNHYYNNGIKQSTNNGNNNTANNNNNSQNVSNVSADGKEKSSPLLASKSSAQQPTKEQSTVSRNLSKTKELMTYNSKKIALITDYSTLFNDKQPQSSVSASTSKIEIQHIPALNNEPQQQQNDNKSNSFPLRLVGQAFSVSQTPSKNIEINFKTNGQHKDEIQSSQQLQHQQQRHLVKVQKDDLRNPLTQDNDISKPIEKDKTLDGEDIKNNKKNKLKDDKHRSSKDNQGQNPLVAYFNVNKASQDNLANNFKIRPFSAQVKPRDHQQQLQLKEQKKRQNKVDNQINNINNNNNGNNIETAVQSSSQTVTATTTTAQTDAMKLEQMIKEFRQEAQKIREAPMNIFSSHHQHPSQYKQQQQQQQVRESIQGIQSEKSNENNNDKNIKEQDDKINKNLKENSNQPNTIIKSSDTAATRSKSAHPLLGNKKPSSQVLNQLNDKEILKAKAPQNTKLPGGITLISQSSSRKQLVDEFIKNNIGRMNNNFIVEPSPTAAAKKKKGESGSKGQDIIDKNQFFYRIDNVSRDFIDSDGKDDNKNQNDDKPQGLINKGPRLKSAVSSIFEKEQYKSNITNPNHNGSTATQEEASKLKQQQPPGKVLLLNNTRPQTSSGIRKKYTLKDLTGDSTTSGTATATGLTNNKGNDLLLTNQ